MKNEPFGFFAPPPPEKHVAPAIDSPLLLKDFVQVDPEQADSPQDPVAAFIAKAQADAQLAKSNSTVNDEQLTRLMCAPADVRGPVTLSKAAAADDWGWDTSVSTDAPMSKRASPARERFRQQLEEFFPNHEEEVAEICAAAAKVSALLAEEAA